MEWSRLCNSSAFQNRRHASELAQMLAGAGSPRGDEVLVHRQDHDESPLPPEPDTRTRRTRVLAHLSSFAALHGRGVTSIVLWWCVRPVRAVRGEAGIGEMGRGAGLSGPCHTLSVPCPNRLVIDEPAAGSTGSRAPGGGGNGNTPLPLPSREPCSQPLCFHDRLPLALCRIRLAHRTDRHHEWRAGPNHD